MKNFNSRSTQIESLKKWNTDVFQMYQDKYLEVWGYTHKKAGLCLMAWKGRADKAFANYRFHSAEKRTDWVARTLKSLEDHRNWKAEQKKAQEDNHKKINAGDILYTSWGYDQTQVEYYKVIEKPSKWTVIIQEIGASIVEGSEGMDCCSLLPDKENTIGEPFKKRITRNGDIKICDVITAWKWDGAANYKSWYR